MKSWTVFVFFIMIISSCKKKDDIKDDGALYSLSINTNNITHEILNKSTTSKSVSKRAEDATSGSDITAYINKLFFFVYSADGSYKGQQQQVAGKDAGFGKAKFNLTAGKYKLFVLGLKLPVNSSFYLNETRLLNTINMGWDEELGHVFTNGVFEFEVGASLPNVNADIELTRKTSQLDIIIEDEIPQGVNQLTMTTNKINNFYFFATNSFSPFDYVRKTNDFVGKKNTKFSFIIIQDKDEVKYPVKMIFTGSPYTGQLITIPEVTLQRNKITQLKGRAFNFDSSGGNKFEIMAPKLEPDTTFVSL